MVFIGLNIVNYIIVNNFFFREVKHIVFKLTN